MAKIYDAILRLNTDSMVKGLEQAEDQIKSFEKTFMDQSKAFYNSSRDMERTGKTMSKTFTAPAVAVGGMAGKIGMDFEAMMSEVAAVSGASADEMEMLEKAAREAGATTNKSATESAEALKYMGLAGWSVEESTKALLPILKLSSAGNIDLGRTSDLVTDSMSALGMGVDELDSYLDILAQASRNSNTDIDALGEAFISVGGRLDLLNVPIEEGATALGILADSGIKGSEAGRGLNAILTNLTAPTGRAEKAMEELGVRAFDSAGEFKGIEAVLQEVEDSMSGMTQEQKNMYYSMIAGKEHSKTFNALIGSLDDSFQNLSTSVGDADGSLEEMYDEMTDNTKGMWDEFISMAEEVGLQFFEVLQPYFEQGIQMLKDGAAWLQNLSPEMKDMIVKVAGLLAVIGPLLIVGSKLLYGINRVFFNLSGMAKGIKHAGGIMKWLSNPMSLIVIKFLAIIAVIILVIRHWDDIKAKAEEIFPGITDTISNMAENVKTIFSALFEIVKGLLEDFLTVWNVVWTLLEPIVDGVIENIKVIIDSLLGVLDGIIEFIAGVFSGNWEKAWQGIVKIFENIFTGIVEIAKNVINSGIGFINKFIEGANKFSVPDWVPVVGGKGINIPLIPELAKGTDFWEGGVVRINEAGGEIVDLPKGSRVYPHDKSVNKAYEDGRKQNKTVKQEFNMPKLADTIIVREDADIDRIIDKMYKKFKVAKYNTIAQGV